MRVYKCLNKNVFSGNGYTLLPIRDEDKYQIMDWRNEQIDILRQSGPLTREEQENYFEQTVSGLFNQEKPKQILWSFFLDNDLIGYGGLVHIDWDNRTAEISFLTETSRNKSPETFISDWFNYLSILKEIASDELQFESVYTYAYDVRPNLYIALEKAGFKESERIKNAVIINQHTRDVVIHTFTFDRLRFRFANESDVDLYFRWANDETVRKNSFNSGQIKFDEHQRWFIQKLNSNDCYFYLFQNQADENVGQVRIDKSGKDNVIGISIDEKHRGFGWGSEMLRVATADFFKKSGDSTIFAYIKKDNIASIKQFLKAGFGEMSDYDINGTPSVRLIKKNERV